MGSTLWYGGSAQALLRLAQALLRHVHPRLRCAHPQLRLSSSCSRPQTKTEPAKGNINPESIGILTFKTVQPGLATLFSFLCSLTPVATQFQEIEN
jgi:hypothetical protein